MKSILKNCFLYALIFSISVFLTTSKVNALNNNWTYLVRDGFNPKLYNWSLHCNDGDIVNTANPYNQYKAISVKINKFEDFKNVLNGAPRAEGLLNNLQFINNKEYYITFKTKLPPSYTFEAQNNRMVFMQIHQKENSGNPPFSLVLDKNEYKIASQHDSYYIASAINDINKLIKWEIYYKPSSTNTGYVQIIKNGKTLCNYVNVKTAYSSNGYLKIGLYKWAWLNQPSNVTDQSMFYSDLIIAVKN